MGFKEQLAKDLKNVFFNTNEFAEIHNVEGEDVPVVIDKDLFKEKYKEIETEDIIDILGITLFIQKEHLRGEPKVNREMDAVDGKTYTIRDSS